MFEEVLSLAKTSRAFRAVRDQVEGMQEEVKVSRLFTSSLALLLGYLFEELNSSFLVLTPTVEHGEELRQDLSQFLEEVVWLPPPEEDLDSAESRILSLSSLISGGQHVLVVPVQSLSPGFPEPEDFRDSIVEMAIGETVGMEALVRDLGQQGYERVGVVEVLGELAVRGGIVDLFPFGFENPLRIEFSGDRIVSLREFDPITQRSISSLQRVQLLPFRETEATTGSLLKYLSEGTIVVLDRTAPYPMESELGVGKRILLNGGGMEVGIEPQLPFQGNLALFRKTLKKLAGYRCFFLSESEAERERMEDILGEEFPELAIRVGSLSQGFIADEIRVALFTDQDLFGRPRRRKPRRKLRAGISIEDLLSLKVGNYVVHIDYGIGVYDGMERIDVDGKATDCLLLRYAEGDKLYVPVERMGLVQRYVGPSERPPSITKLGTKSWLRRKSRAKKGIKDMTRELLEIYAARKVWKGFSFPPDNQWQRELEASFSYDETEDQLRAIEEIKEDMESDNPMDRLVTGEVGYGKTEVALRAAFKAVMGGKQVALLAPTTILVEQHHNTFKERLGDFPIVIEQLSRFRKREEQKKVCRGIGEGKVDIVIGTHRLLGKDVKFRDLGLVIVDEEQNFGVAQKEQLKKLRKVVDFLSMSATPIPRTLNMALVGVRNLSTIETPPAGRLSVVTEISEWDENLIQDVVLREVARGGQVYFVHNRVQSIWAIAQYVKRLLPEVRIGVAHGQMLSSELEKMMLKFLRRDYDVLVSTAIIQSGIDMPNVNTMLVNRADRFGLAQLHQLRGRVGRSTRRAYCYLLIPKRRRMTDEAKKRLSAIRSYSQLGSGFKLALRDLEIRGAGNLLGREQHGHLAAVGYELYCQLLEEAVRELKGESVKPRVETTLRLLLDAYIPDTYLGDHDHKLGIYKRLSSMSKLEEVEELKLELRDRFGKLPLPTSNLLEVMGVRIIASDVGIEKVAVRDGELELTFARGREPSREIVESLVRASGAPLRFYMGERFSLRAKPDKGDRMQFLKKLLQNLASSDISERRSHGG